MVHGKGWGLKAKSPGVLGLAGTSSVYISVEEEVVRRFGLSEGGMMLVRERKHTEDALIRGRRVTGFIGIATMSAGCFRDALDSRIPHQAPSLNPLQSKAPGLKGPWSGWVFNTFVGLDLKSGLHPSRIAIA